jgi:hypothetical protein
VFAPGDTISLSIYAADNRRVRWVGLEFIEPVATSDSFEVTDSLSGVLLSVRLIMGATFAGLVRVKAFARDDQGQRAEAVLLGNPISVYATVTRQVVSAQLDVLARHVAFDLKRGLVYLSQPDSGRIAVLSLSTGTFATPLVPPVPPAGIDLSAGGDSLVVALPDLRALGILDLTSTSPTWQTIALAFDTSWGRHPDNLRVSAANTVIVSITATGVTGAVGQVVAHRMSTGYQTLRNDVSYWDGYPGTVTDATLMARSADRSRILLLFDNSCCPESGQIYVSQSDAFLARQPTVQRYGPAISADGSGNVFLVGNTLFSNALTQPVAYHPPGEAWASALSQGGDTAYFGFRQGFFRTRLADGATVEWVSLPEAPLRLYSIPGPGERVLAISGTTATVVTLGAVPQSARARAAPVLLFEPGVRTGGEREFRTRP